MLTSGFKWFQAGNTTAASVPLLEKTGFRATGYSKAVLPFKLY